MGRYSTDVAGPPPAAPSSPLPQCPFGQPSYSMPQAGVPQTPAGWPTSFPKPIVALDLNGVIIEDTVLKGSDSVRVLPGVLDAIRTIRLKGYKLFILSDQPSISKGLNTPSNIEASFQHLMSVFGQAGIFSIDGFLYNTSEIKDDEFAKPNLGMVKRAEREMIKNARFKDGWYVGDSMVDLKFADKMESIPVLVKTGNHIDALEQLDRFTYKDIKSKTKVFNTLLEFANYLP